MNWIDKHINVRIFVIHISLQVINISIIKRNSYCLLASLHYYYFFDFLKIRKSIILFSLPTKTFIKSHIDIIQYSSLLRTVLSKDIQMIH